MKKKALGRGLGALIPDVERPEAPPNEIDIDRIAPNPHQPRLLFDEERLGELTASIRENGVLQPVLVRPFGRNYQLIAGERRLSAAQRAGLLKIPAVIREVPDDRLLELALVENIQREQLNPIEEAQAYQHLMEEIGQTQEQMAERLGKDRSTVANAIRLLKLPPAVSRLVSEGKLSPGHARALLSADVSPAEMGRMAGVILEKGWSVRETERRVKKRKAVAPLPRIQDPNEAAAEDRLRLALGARVEIVPKSKNSGEIRIHYYGHEELMRLFALLEEKQNSTEHKHGIQTGKIGR